MASWNKKLAVLFAAAAVAACGGGGSPDVSPVKPPESVPVTPPAPTPPPPVSPSSITGVTPTVPVALTEAQMNTVHITDPAVIGGFTLNAVVGAIIESKLGSIGNTVAARQSFIDSLSQSFLQTSFRNPLSGIEIPVTPRPALAGLLASDLLDGAEGYRVAALTLRSDLAPADGENCGEARITLEKAFPERATIIFEGGIETPDPFNPEKGCQAVKSFFAGLGDLTPLARKVALEEFFFKGKFTTPDGQVFAIKPVIHADNYGNAGGQVRVNSFVDSPWILTEHLVALVTDANGKQKLVLKRNTVANSPWMDLYHDEQPEDSAAKKALKREFQDMFMAKVLPQVLALYTDSLKTGKAVTDSQLMAQGVTISSKFSGFESVSDSVSDVQANIGTAFAKRISDELAALLAAKKIPFEVTLGQALNIVEKESCAGCHFVTDGKPLAHSTGVSPIQQSQSQPFTHIDEVGGVSEFMQRQLGFRFETRRMGLDSAAMGKLARALSAATSGVAIPAVPVNPLEVAMKRDAAAAVPGSNGFMRPTH